LWGPRAEGIVLGGASKKKKKKKKKKKTKKKKKEKKKKKKRGPRNTLHTEINSGQIAPSWVGVVGLLLVTWCRRK